MIESIENVQSCKWQLERFRVTNFRSIIDSGYINIKNQTTVLIGSNRAGKSSILRSLEKLNYRSKFEKFDLTQLGDISFDYINGKISGDKIKIIEAEFSPINKINGNEDKLIVSKFFDSSYHMKIGKNEYKINGNNIEKTDISMILQEMQKIGYESNNSQAITQLLIQLENIQSLIEKDELNYNKIFMMIDIIVGLPFEDEIKNKIESSVQEFKNIVTSRDVPEMLNELPKFIYFSAYDRLEDKATLIELKENPELHTTFINLLRMAEIDIERLESMDSDERVAYLEKASNKISAKLSDIWGSKRGRLEIRYEQEKSPIILIMVTPEDSREYLVPPSMESDGFQWFLSVFINLEYGTSGNYSNSFLLLDDLGVLLHPGKQKSFLDFLKDKLPKSIYLIYTTHLPFFIPLDIPESILLLTRENSSTKIVSMLDLHKKWKTEKEVLAPIRAALGFGLLDNFFIGKLTFLVEDISDQILLNFVWDQYNRIKHNIINKDVVFVGQTNNIDIFSYALWMKYNDFPFYIILNDNEYGRETKDKLNKIGISDGIVKIISSKIGIENSTVEDFIDPDILAKAFSKYYKLYDKDQTSDLLLRISKNGSVLKTIEKYCMENSIIMDNKGFATEIVNVMKSDNDSNSIIRLYNILFPFIKESEFKYNDHNYSEPIRVNYQNNNDNNDDDNNNNNNNNNNNDNNDDDNNNNGNVIIKEKADNIKNKNKFDNIKRILSNFNPFSKSRAKTLDDNSNNKNLASSSNFNPEAKEKIMNISISDGIALLTGDKHSKKVSILSSIIRNADSKGRKVSILTTAREKNVTDLLGISDLDVNIFSLSFGYFKQRIISDINDATTLASKLYVEITRDMSDSADTLFIIYKSNDITPITKNGRNTRFEDEFWHVFFHFLSANIKNDLFLFVCDKESDCEGILLYADTIIRPTISGNLIDVNVEKSLV